MKVQVDKSTNKTHFMMFKDLLRHSSLNNCVNVWTGFYPPRSVASYPDEQLALEELMVMMFEQEINWGDENFQAFAAFSIKRAAKPRDMLMRFANIVFTNRSVESIPNWQWDKAKKFRSTPDLQADIVIMTSP
ncbi:hypothetical protein [Rossellomorea sp. NRS-1567]|uniref:hypothetical protein n=1 Tax=Rossellomorea sp. NRS-1567 TaxID=3233901 RepID=UPI003D2E6E0B